MTEAFNKTPPPAEDDESGAELMYVRCSVCGKWLDVKPGHINYISHTFCPECYAAEMQKLNRDAEPRKGPQTR